MTLYHIVGPVAQAGVYKIAIDGCRDRYHTADRIISNKTGFPDQVIDSPIADSLYMGPERCGTGKWRRSNGSDGIF